MENQTDKVIAGITAGDFNKTAIDEYIYSFLAKEAVKEIDESDRKQLLDLCREKLNLDIIYVVENLTYNEGFKVTYESYSDENYNILGKTYIIDENTRDYILSYYDGDNISDRNIAFVDDDFNGKMLHYRIAEGEQVDGSVGFINFNNDRQWTDDDRACLIKLGRIITRAVRFSRLRNFYTELRAQQKHIEEIDSREKQRSNVISALMKEYTTVFLIDFDKDMVTPFRLSERFNGETERMSGKYEDVKRFFRNFIEGRLRLVNDGRVWDIFDKDYIKKQLLNDNVFFGNENFYDENGQLQYFQAQFVRIGDSREVSEVVIGFRNVSEEVRVEMENKRIVETALRQAELASKAKTIFLSNMSHDMRTPMNAIIGYASLANSHIDNKVLVKNYLEKILNSSSHLLDLINDVLDMSMIESGRSEIKLSKCSIAATLRDIKIMMQSECEKKNLKLRTKVEVDSDTVMCDYLKLNQILTNCISNAVKFTPMDGQITILVSEDKINSEEKGIYRFIIKDTGIGMDKKFLKHIFEPFTRARTSTVSGVYGTGLGMSITKQLVDMMNGSIDIISEEGVGTQITITIEFEHSETQVYNSYYETDPMRFKKKCNLTEIKENEELNSLPEEIRILVVEDNEYNREIIEEILKEEGYNVETAGNGKNAIKMVEDSQPGYYNIILMDVQMPVMDGYEATRYIRKLPKPIRDIPIVAMTANAFEEDRKNAFENGMNAHISKPIDLDKLFKTINRLTRKEEEFTE